MRNYEVFLLVNDDEFSLGTVGEILISGEIASLTALFADLIGNMAYSLEDQTTQAFKIELRSPDGL